MADGTLRRIIEGTGQLCVAKLLGDVDGYSEELVNEALNGLQHGAAHRLQLCDIKWECWQQIPHHLSILCHPDDNKVADGAGECLRQYSVAEEQIVARGLIGDEANKLLHLLSHIVLSEKYPYRALVTLLATRQKGRRELPAAFDPVLRLLLLNVNDRAGERPHAAIHSYFKKSNKIKAHTVDCEFRSEEILSALRSPELCAEIAGYVDELGNARAVVREHNLLLHPDLVDVGHICAARAWPIVYHCDPHSKYKRRPQTVQRQRDVGKSKAELSKKAGFSHEARTGDLDNRIAFVQQLIALDHWRSTTDMSDTVFSIPAQGSAEWGDAHEHFFHRQEVATSSVGYQLGQPLVTDAHPLPLMGTEDAREVVAPEDVGGVQGLVCDGDDGLDDSVDVEAPRVSHRICFTVTNARPSKSKRLCGDTPVSCSLLSTDVGVAMCQLQIDNDGSGDTVEAHIDKDPFTMRWTAFFGNSAVLRRDFFSYKIKEWVVMLNDPAFQDGRAKDVYKALAEGTFNDSGQRVIVIVHARDDKHWLDVLHEMQAAGYVTCVNEFVIPDDSGVHEVISSTWTLTASGLRSTVATFSAHGKELALKPRDVPIGQATTFELMDRMDNDGWQLALWTGRKRPRPYNIDRPDEAQVAYIYGGKVLKLPPREYFLSLLKATADPAPYRALGITDIHHFMQICYYDELLSEDEKRKRGRKRKKKQPARLPLIDDGLPIENDAPPKVPRRNAPPAVLGGPGVAVMHGGPGPIGDPVPIPGPGSGSGGSDDTGGSDASLFDGDEILFAGTPSDHGGSHPPESPREPSPRTPPRDDSVPPRDPPPDLPPVVVPPPDPGVPPVPLDVPPGPGRVPQRHARSHDWGPFSLVYFKHSDANVPPTWAAECAAHCPTGKRQQTQVQTDHDNRWWGGRGRALRVTC